MTSDSQPRSAVAAGYAWYALTVLTFINLINYVDRFVLASFTDAVRDTFNLSRDEVGSLGTAFFVVYVISPFIGFLGDKVARRKLIAGGIALWSAATIASAFADNFYHLWIARAATGIGELCYGIVAPAFLSDLFTKESRSRTLSIFYLALPVGTAAGYAFGGYVGQNFGHAPGVEHDGFLCGLGIHEGWRYAFLGGGFPGLTLAFLAWFLREPARGGMDTVDGGHVAVGRFRWEGVWELLKTPSFVANVAANTAMTFAIGGIGFWAPEFIQEVHQYSKAQTNALFGVMVAVTGFLGTIAGGFLADYARRWTRSAHFIVPGLTLVFAGICLLPALLSSRREVFWALSGISVFLLFCNSGPLNAAISNVSMPAVRTTAFAITIFTIHVLGDALSPKLIGKISDAFEASRGHAESLRLAMLIAPPATLLAGIILLAFAKWLPRDMAAVSAKLRGEKPETKPAAS